jgi:Domain of unknown function (DUF6745)
VTGHRRARARRRRSSPIPVDRLLDLWHHASRLRDEWLGHGLSAERADRPTAEDAVTGLYRLLGVAPPSFEWIDSPGAAPPGIALTTAPFRLTSAALGPADELPLAARLATLQSTLRASLDGSVGRPAAGSPRASATVDELRAGHRTLGDLLEVGIMDPLRETLRDAVAVPLRETLVGTSGTSLWFTWYGQHDGHWVGYYDVHRALGRTRYDPDDDRQLDLWATLARSAGWWWPAEGLCVLSDRPTEVHTEPVPGASYGQRRLHNQAGPAVRYADGWGMYAWHGIRVPAWVVTGPTVARIAAERNIEVRRCAIEHLGWDTYIERAGLRLINAAPDPGNPGADLVLYELPPTSWQRPERVLLAVNGSVERDGARRRYGLMVPTDIDDPVAAAAWSYGLSGAQYAQLARRT